MKKFYHRGLFLVLSLVLMISGTAILGAAPDKEQVPDLNQAQWLILGTFSNPPTQRAREVWWDYEGFHRDYLTAAGGETGVSFKKGQIIAGKMVVPGMAKNGRVNLLSLYPNSANVVAYAYVEFNSSRAQKVALKLGSDDGIKVWLNGSLIWANHSHRMVIPDQDAVAANLKRGANRLLVKVEQLGVDWGFSVRMRSLADEAADWTKVKEPGLQILLPYTLMTEKSQAWCVVETTPALVVPEPVTLLIYDGEGKQLASRKGTVGEPVALQLPAEYEGVIKIQAVSGGKPAGVKSPEVLALIGDYRKITTNAVAEARAISKEFTYNGRSEDLGATLTFLADQLEGKMHQSLITPERNLRAIQSIADIKKVLQQGPWQTGTLRGIRQWAYRSAVDDSCQPYTVYLPKNYDPQKQYRLLLSLHGHTTDDYFAVKTVIDYHQPDDFIIVGAFGRGDMWYLTFAERDVLDVLNRVQQIYNIDPDQVYLTGESMGGLGTWRMGQFYADRFAAIAPFCGWTGTDYLENLRNLPVYIVHGDADSLVPYSMDEAAACRLRELGYDIRYEKLPGADHNAWDALAQTQGGEVIFEYFRKYRRNPWPMELNLQTNYLRYGRQYWVRIKELGEPLVPGSVHAVVKGSREIQLETKGIVSLSLDLRHPKLEQTGSVTVNIDNQALTVTAGQSDMGFNYIKDLGWRKNQITASVPSKIAPHSGGGMADLLYGPVLFVYGTQKPERTQILKRVAEKMGDFSMIPQFEIGCKVGHLLIKADSEVSEAELKNHNLFLIGNADENLVTAALNAEWDSEFPVRLIGDDLRIGNREFKKSSLSLAYPNPWAPEYLTGVFTFPFSKEEIEQLTEFINIPYRYSPLNGSAIECFILPDILVRESPKVNIFHSWSFDQDWKELIPLPGWRSRIRFFSRE